jgi:signal transduction histidine kinase
MTNNGIILISHEIIIQITGYRYPFESIYIYMFIALFILGLIALVLNYRYKALRNVGKVRTELANDIHDEIGTMLTKAVMKTELLRRKAGNTYPEIAGIEQNLRDAVFSFRSILWSLNTDNRTMDDFVGKINMLLAHSFEQTNFQFLVTNRSPNVFFDKSIRVKRNLLFIFKELAHNAMKHSDGNLFEIIIRSYGNKWYFLIVDNGSNLTRNVLETGLGLKSVRERLKKLKGSVEIRKKEIGFYINIIL